MAILKSLINTGVTRLLGKVYMNDELEVAGTVVLSKTQDLSGTADYRPALIVGDSAGVHIEIDGNEIHAKNTATTTAGLYLNNEGGAVYLSNGTNKVYANNGTITAPTTSFTNCWMTNGYATTALNVGPSGGYYLSSNSNGTTIASLSSTTGSITTLSSSTINAENVNVTNVLRSARWNIQSVAQMGGSLYVSPTLYFPNQATTLNITKNGSTLTITITDSTFNTNDLCGFVWTVNSRVKVSAKIGGVVTGTMDGVIQNINTDNGTITLQVGGENSNNVVAGSYTSSGFSDMSVMMYQRRDGSYDYHTGIWLNCYDNSNESATIRLYGGNSQYPNVMIGNLTGADLQAVENTTPTGWGLYSDNVFLTGTIFSENGRIGGWKISDKGLRKGTLGQPGSIYLIPYDATDPNYQDSDKITIAGSGRLDNWTITSSETFGVTSDGSVYMNRGRVGNWVLSPDALYNLNLGTSPRIPSDYQEVEYLSFNEGAFFQKDFDATSGQTVIARIKFQYLGSLTENFMVAGDGANKNSFCLEFGHYGGVWYNGTYQVASDGDYPNQIMEGYQSKTLTANVTYNYGIGQICGYAADNTQSVKVWYVRIYIAPANGAAELAYEFVPCYRKSDGVIGMYETVNGEFIYTNQGAGTITKGLDIVGVSPNLMYPGTYVGTDRIYNYKDQDTFVEIKDGVITAKNAVINGNITSVTGNIGGWTIGADSIYKVSSTMGNSSTGSAYFGTSGLSITDKFKVTSAGVLTATGATISGDITANTGSIGGWTIGENKLYYTSDTPGATNSMIFSPQGISSTTSIGGSPANTSKTWAMSIKNGFGVTTRGDLYCNNGKLGGIYINSNVGIYTAGKDTNTGNNGFIISNTGGIIMGPLSNGSYPFQVTNTGVLTATGATISGTVKATTGKIGAWAIDNWHIYYKGYPTVWEFDDWEELVENIPEDLYEVQLIARKSNLTVDNSTRTFLTRRKLYGSNNWKELFQIQYEGTVICDAFDNNDNHTNRTRIRPSDIIIQKALSTDGLSNSNMESSMTCQIESNIIRFNDSGARRGTIQSASSGVLAIYALSTLRLGHLTSDSTATDVTITSSAVSVERAFTAKSTLAVTGNSTFTGSATFNGNVTLNGSNTFNGSTTFNNNATLADGKSISFGGTAALIRNGTFIQFSSGHDAITGDRRHIVLDKNDSLRFQAASSKRYKNYVGDESDEDAKKLLTLPVIKFIYKSDYLDKNDRNYGKPLVGLFAEDVAERFDDAGCYDKDSQVENYWDRQLLVRLIKLCQIQQREIDELKNELKNKLK